MSTEVLELLKLPVETLTTNLKGEKGEIITVDKKASLPDVLQLLTKHDIRSVPVVDKEQNRLLGLVDMIDIITFIVRFAEECHGLPAAQRNFEWFSEQLQKSGQTIAQIAGLSGEKSKLIPVMHGTSINDVMQIMVKNGVQRVPVMNPLTNALENFVTQSTLIQYFAKNSAKFGKYGEYTLSELGFKPKHVFSVKETDLAIDAFKMMSEHKITGIPIVDNEGTIITNISSRDLRNVLTDTSFFEKLQLPAERFVSDLKSKTFLHNAETMYPKICCKFSNKFVEVLHKLAATRIHRIYVVENTEKPVGVISLDDIVAKIFEITKENEVPPARSLSAQY